MRLIDFFPCSVLHDVMGPYQLVAPNWRPPCPAHQHGGSDTPTVERDHWCAGWCCLDTQGYLMMLSQQRPTTTNIIIIANTTI